MVPVFSNAFFDDLEPFSGCWNGMGGNETMSVYMLLEPSEVHDESRFLSELYGSAGGRSWRGKAAIDWANVTTDHCYWEGISCIQVRRWKI